jgi:hypothetical protein
MRQLLVTRGRHGSTDRRSTGAPRLDATDVRQPTRESSDWVTGTVVYEQNRQDAMRIRDTATARNSHGLDYASPEFRRAMARLGARERTIVQLSRTGRRANVWCVDAMSGQPQRE